MSHEKQIGEYSFVQKDENKLGQGTYANVYKGYHRKTKEFVAIKLINFDDKTAQDQKYLTQEISLMKEINHPNTIRLLAMEKIGPIIHLVIEYCAGRDLKSYLEKQPNKRLDEDTARHFMCQIASGLRYLHNKGIIHRDLKPQNILLTEHSPRAELKICDFGFARYIAPQMNSILGSPLYMAPEILMGRPYTAKSDLWSVGCIFYEMLMGQTPLTPTSMAHLRQLVSDGQPINRYPVSVSVLCKELLDGLLQKRSSERFDWQQFLEHQYLAPENLSRSTLVNQNTSVELPSKNAWLQHIFYFFPQGDVITLYVKPSHLISAIKSALEKLIHTPEKDQLLLDDEGKVLQDHLPLGFYHFQQNKRAIFLIHWPLLIGESKFPSLKIKYDIPHPILPCPPAIALLGVVNSMDQIVDYHERCKNYLNYVQSLYKNIKTRSANLTAYNMQYDHQHEVYKVSRKHVIRAGSELQQSFKSVEDLFNEISTVLGPMLKNFDNVVEELRNTTIHDSLKYLVKAKTLLEIVDENSVRSLYKSISDEYNSISSQMVSAKESAIKINEEVDIVARTKLDDLPFKEIRSTKVSGNEQVSNTKKSVSSFQENLKQAGRLLTELRSSAKKRTESDYDQIRKYYTDLPNLLNSIMKEDKDSSTSLILCQQAKEKATSAMAVNMHSFGKVILNIEHTLKTIGFVRQGLVKLQPCILDLSRISKLYNSYQECLKEVKRRRTFGQKVEKIHKNGEKYFKGMIEEEITKRLAFKQIHQPFVISQLFPCLTKSEQEEKTLLPLQLSINLFDKDLPDIGELPVTLEDDFSLLIEDAPESNEAELRRKEQENAQLLEKISLLIKQNNELLKPNEPSLSNQKIVDLQKENEALRNMVKAPIPEVDSKALEALREENNKLLSQVQQLSSEQQVLTKKNQILLGQLNQQTSLISTSSDHQKISELEEKLSKAENLVARYTEPEVRRLNDMGFPIELARQAVLNTKTLEEAIQWLLERSRQTNLKL